MDRVQTNYNLTAKSLVVLLIRILDRYYFFSCKSCLFYLLTSAASSVSRTSFHQPPRLV